MFICRSNISSGQILSCEYTVHPRWLNDLNDGAENLWPENMPKQSSQDEMELVEDEVVIEEPAPIDFDWVEERENETEETGTEDIIFEQDIPASLEEEVVIGEVSEFDENENSDCCSQSSQGSERGAGDSPTKYSNQLPVAYVPESNSPQNSSKGNTSKLDKTKRPTVKFKQTLSVCKNLLILNQRSFAIDPKAGTSLLKSEVREKSSVGQLTTGTNNQNADSKYSVQVKNDSRVARSLKKQGKQRYRIQSSIAKAKPIGRHTETVGGKARKFVDIHGENITINHDVDECKPGGSDEAQIIDSQLNNKVGKLAFEFFCTCTTNNTYILLFHNIDKN